MKEALAMTWQEMMAAAAAFSGIIAGLIIRDRAVHSKISDGDERVRESVKKDTEQLHKRVSELRDNSVRTSEFDRTVARFERAQHELTRQIEANRREQTDRHSEIMGLLMHGHAKSRDG